MGCKNYSLRKAAQLNKLQDIWGRPFVGKSDKAMDCYMGGFISILSSFKRFYSFVFMYCMASLGEKLTTWQADKPKNKKNSQKVG